MSYHPNNPKIDLYQIPPGKMGYEYVASTNWYKTVREALQHSSLVATFPGRKWAACKEGSSRLTKRIPTC